MPSATSTCSRPARVEERLRRPDARRGPSAPSAVSQPGLLRCPITMRARVPAVAGPADPQEVPVADLGWPELTIIAIAVVVLFGWKRMPDMARSLGRSARIFKSEVDQMKTPDPVAEA